jgi:hypothetical protein
LRGGWTVEREQEAGDGAAVVIIENRTTHNSERHRLRAPIYTDGGSTARNAEDGQLGAPGDGGMRLAIP